MLLTGLLERQKNNQKIAIKQGEKECTYTNWYNSSMSLSEKLNKFSEKNSNNIAVFLPNSISYAIAYFAILFSKKVIVPIDVQCKGPEIASILEYCETDIIITSMCYRDFLIESLLPYKYKVLIIFVDQYACEIANDTNTFFAKSGAIDNTGNEEDVAILLHTSGTTSNPKRVMLTHRNLISNIESNIQSLKLTEADKCLIAMPMYFGYCNTAQFLTHLYLGASIVILDGMFFPKTFFFTVQNEQITDFTGVPSMLLTLLKYRYASKYDISSLRYICFGGGKMPEGQLRELIQLFSSVGFVQTYGQTEASPRITALLSKDALRKIGSVGTPIPNVRVKVVDEMGNQLSANAIGEVIVQGKNIMKGYFKQEKITKNTIIDGWLHTGDLGYHDEDGYLYLTGRKKNMIISGGINIYPEEIEEVLMSHPNVCDVCVFAENHLMLGEVPAAKIVLRNSNTNCDLRTFCIERLAIYKVPVKFELVDNLEKTYNGKIKRKG